MFYAITVLFVAIPMITLCYHYAKRAYKLRKYLNLPPAISSPPLVGLLPFLGDEPHKRFHQLRKQYGPVFSLYLGSRYTVILCDYSAIKEAGNQEAYADHPKHVFQLSTNFSHIIDMIGQPWREQKRFLVNSLRSLGMGKRAFEDNVLDQVSKVIERLKEHVGKPEINIRTLLLAATNNTIFSIVNGKVYENEHPTNDLMNLYNYQSLTIFAENKTLMYYPYWRPFQNFFNGKVRSAKMVVKKFESFLRNEIENHRTTLDENCKRDYIDYYLAETKEKDVGHSFTAENLNGNCQFMLLAGSEGVRSNIEWVMLCMALFQDVQEKVFQEIYEVLGQERFAEYADKDRLPYTQATILEVMRWKTLQPINDPRWTNADSKVKGYDIPSDTLVLMNMYSVHYDEDIFGDPENFKPEHFLSEDGTRVINGEYMMAFGVGKRFCPGEKIGRIGIFLFVTSLLQRFRILPPKDGINLEGKSLFTQKVVSPFIKLELR